MTDSARPFEGLALAVAAPSRQWVTNEGGIDWALRRRAFSAAGYGHVTVRNALTTEREVEGELRRFGVFLATAQREPNR